MRTLAAALAACILAASTRTGDARPTLATARAVQPSDPPPIRGLYVNRFAAQSPKKMRSLIALADTTEINAFVIDIKDEFGINYQSRDTLVRRNAGRGGFIPDLHALLDTLHAHHISAIARIVVFKDSVAARTNPLWTIRTEDGNPWRDKQRLTWVNPYTHDLWEYDFRVAEEAAGEGFDEIQFDYIRFPEPYKSLPPQVFPGAGDEAKPDVLADFLKVAHRRLAALGVRTTADVFGLVTSVRGALEIGQQWEQIASSVDVVLPMVYPSHYPPGSFGLPHPNAEPYKVVFGAVSAARRRDDKMGLTGNHVRPYLQAFTLGHPPYGPAEVRAEKQAVYDAGYQGWVLWNPGSRYDAFAGALDRQKPQPMPPAPAPLAHG
jgi:hypothetical protein